MRLIVIAPDGSRADILAAGLELSGYQNDVKVVDSGSSLQRAIAQATPRLLIVDHALGEYADDIYAVLQGTGKISCLIIGDHPITADVTLPTDYQFHDFLIQVYRLAPLDDADVEKKRSSYAETEAKYRDLFNRASDGIFLIDYTTHLIIDANKQIEKIYGYTRDEIIGMSLLQIVPQEEHPSMLRNTRRMREEQVFLHVTDRTHIRKDGTQISVNLSAGLIEYGGRLVFQDIVRDETARIQQEEELKYLNQMKDEFVSNISHELKSPLTSLSLRLHLLKRIPQALDQHVETLEREIERLRALIENLLILSRLDQNRQAFLLSGFDANDLVQEYYQDRQPVAEAADLIFKLVMTPQQLGVHASRDLLGQVLSILLTNAINYTPAGGEITLETAIVAHDGQQWVQIRVQDTGIGIPAEEQDALFERFYRGSVGIESTAAGTGLGLAIAKEIVERHHGHITVESAGIPGQGATFSIWLQLAPDTSLIQW